MWSHSFDCVISPYVREWGGILLKFNILRLHNVTHYCAWIERQLFKSSLEVIQEARFAQYGKNYDSILWKPLKNYDSITLQHLQPFPETLTLKYSWTLASSAYSNEDYRRRFWKKVTSYICKLVGPSNKIMFWHVM